MVKLTRYPMYDGRRQLKRLSCVHAAIGLMLRFALRR